ncbi:MAG: TetR/AcrR family transcriptional regulator [Peptococcaceae bacterium]|nr:TetR/AcrR family transcriptional regulator [Peptococcaceae bacterium]
MYHIKEDKRCLTSAQLITEGLSDCLMEKDFNKITVTDIQRKTGVSRATFYRLFDDMSDILAFQCDQCFDQIYQTCLKNGVVSIPMLLNEFLLFWMEHIQLLEIIMKINRSDIFFSCHMRHFEQLRQCASKLEEQDYLDEYYVAISSGMMISVLVTWLKRGKQETAEEIRGILRIFLKSLLNHHGKFDISKDFFALRE